MTQFDIRIQLRRDTSANWETINPVLKIGELAFAINAGVVERVKLGINLPWNDTPTLLTPLKPINTVTGRNLNSPAPPFNTTHNLSDINDMMQLIFNPYSPPGLSIGTSVPLELQEVGATLTATNKVFSVSITNPMNIKVEGGTKYIYIDNVGRALANQAATVSTVESVTKTITATRNTAGFVEVLRIHVLRSDTSAQIVSTVSVEFRLRSGYFLWPANDDLTTKTDAEISSIVQGIGANLTGVRSSGIAGNGNKSFGTIPFNSSTLGSGLYNIYVFNPVSAGTAVIAPDAFRTSPVIVQHKTFEYVKASTITSYRLTKMTDPIEGEYNAYIQ